MYIGNNIIPRIPKLDQKLIPPLIYFFKRVTLSNGVSAFCPKEKKKTFRQKIEPPSVRKGSKCKK